MIARNKTLITMVITDVGLYAISVIPNAVPAAGGCSKSSMIINKIVIPTDKENHNALNNTMSINGNAAKHDPIKNPRKWPPMIRFGLAAILFGIAKTINAVAPMLAIITGLLNKVIVMKKTVAAA